MYKIVMESMVTKMSVELVIQNCSTQTLVKIIGRKCTENMQ